MKNINPREQMRAQLFNRQKAYMSVFDSEHGKIVLEDLARFCREKESTFHSDARLHALLEGRREVFLRIKQHIGMPSEELWDLLHEGKSKNP